MNLLVQRFRGLPRSVRWLVGFGLVVVVYFFGVERAVDFYLKQRTRGDAALAELNRYADAGGAIKSASDAAILGVRHFGEVEFPGSPESRPLEFNRAVDAILAREGVAGQTSNTRQITLGGNGPLIKRVGNGVRIERLTKVIEFQAEPSVVAKVLAGLEQNPLVATISNVQIRQNDGRDRASTAVNVSITVEAWLQVRKERERSR